MYFYFNNPWLAGVMLTEVTYRSFSLGVNIAHTSTALASFLHIYNALRKTDKIKEVPFVEELIKLTRKQMFHLGDLPEKDFYIKMMLYLDLKPKELAQKASLRGVEAVEAALSRAGSNKSNFDLKKYSKLFAIETDGLHLLLEEKPSLRGAPIEQLLDGLLNVSEKDYHGILRISWFGVLNKLTELFGRFKNIMRSQHASAFHSLKFNHFYQVALPLLFSFDPYPDLGLNVTDDEIVAVAAAIVQCFSDTDGLFLFK
jgi:hypothetical protein